MKFGQSVEHVSILLLSRDLRFDTYEEDHRDVQAKGDQTVEEEGKETNVVNLSHGDLGNLPNESNAQVHSSADRSKVVERD